MQLALVPTVLRGNAYWTIKLTPVWVTTQERGNQRVSVCFRGKEFYVSAVSGPFFILY